MMPDTYEAPMCQEAKEVRRKIKGLPLLGSHARRPRLMWPGPRPIASRMAGCGALSHGFDFVDADRVFEGPTFTYQDDRFSYEVQRFVTLGFLGGVVVSIVHTETEDEIRVISFRKATTPEEIILFESLEN